MLEQCLPFTVLKPDSYAKVNSPSFLVGTVLTVYGIETLGA